MLLMARSFRSEESYVAEQTTRGMLANFLQERGFRDVRDERKSFGRTGQQVIRALDDKGKGVALWVRLCWRRSGARDSKHVYSAAQLTARVINGDWLGTIQRRLDRAAQEGISHLLLVQRVDNRIANAAAIPLRSVLPIWKAQRDKSISLIKQGRLGRRKKNHAMNGVSPTLWLEDSAVPEIGEVLWTHAGVRDLAKLNVGPSRRNQFDDSMDDLPGIDYALIGSDGAGRVPVVTSGVKRDPKVRRAVLARTKGCERKACGITKVYTGFLDVHHILGAEKSDRVWNCVALCPNCHREAHAAPDRDQIDAALLEYASKFRAGNKA
jgi:5-methylcytosine-specific restriction enzyme A